MFNGAFTVDSDRQALEPVVSAIFETTCTQRRQNGDWAAWRRMTSLERFFFDGSATWKPPPLLSVDGFLQKYEFSSVNAVGQNGMRPLHYATYEDNAPLARLLLDAGAEIDARDAGTYPYGSGAECISLLPLHLASV